MKLFGILWESLSENWYIIVHLVFSVVSFVLSVIFAYIVAKFFLPGSGKELKKINYYLLDVVYTLFITNISIFPLLGMFGTVKALLELDLSGNADLNAIKPQFFQALTSTALGIVFAVFFKILNAFIQPYVENQIAKAKKSLKI